MTSLGQKLTSLCQKMTSLILSIVDTDSSFENEIENNWPTRRNKTIENISI